MATILNGILGGFSGKVGTVVGACWNGIDYMRALATNVTNPKTPAQLEQRAKFKVVISFLRSMISFLRTGFRSQAIKMSAFNAAMAYNLKNAITGAYPNYTLDYTKVLVSNGALAGVVNGAAASTIAGKVDFTWDDNSLGGDIMADDKVLLLVYNPLRNQSVSLKGGKTRAEGADSLTVPDLFSGETLECYIGFIGAGGAEVSNSQWVGSVEVA